MSNDDALLLNFPLSPTKSDKTVTHGFLVALEGSEVLPQEIIQIIGSVLALALEKVGGFGQLEVEYMGQLESIPSENQPLFMDEPPKES